MDYSADFQTCLQSLNSESAQRALSVLWERGSLAKLTQAGYQSLNDELVLWLLRAESHAGSELVYLSEEGKARGIPLGSYFDFPDRYSSKFAGYVYLSAETINNQSVILFIADANNETILQSLEAAQQDAPLSTDRPLQERIESKLRNEGHLSCLSADGLSTLTHKLIKHLDYAMNVRSGSEIIYVSANGEIVAEALEKVMQNPQDYVDIPKPVFLAIEAGSGSVLFDTHDLTPTNLWRLRKKAAQVIQTRQNLI